MSTNRRMCKYCGSPLIGMRQKLLRCCLACADKARENYSKMGSGHFKEGLDGILEQTAASINQKEEIKNKLTTTLKNKPGIIKKRLKKRGLTPEEIEEGLKEFNNGLEL